MKKLLASLLAAAILVFSFTVNAFAGENHWAATAITYVCEKGVMANSPDGGFEPDKAITGSELLQAVSKLGGIKFEELTKNNIVPANFAQNENVSRAVMAELVYNYAVYAKKDMKAVNDAASFKDLTDVSTAAKAAIEALQKAGIVNGKAQGVFAPSAVATRAEAAVVLSLVSKLPDVVENVVQSANWWDALPRASWSQFEKVDVSEKWFEVYKLPGDVYAIYEPGQFQEVISFLIIGKDKALLWDTGMGIADIKSCVKELTALPVFVVNSHSHMDHIGGNWQFDEVYIYDMAPSVEKLTNGNSHDAVKDQLEKGSVWMELPKGFDPETYVTKGKAPTGTVKEGDIIDLGNRQLEVIHTPGHSADSIMLIDKANKIIFTGDTYYPASLYAFSRDSDLGTYTKSMRKVAEKIKGMDLEWIYSSHNEVVKGTEILSQVADALEQIYTGKMKDYVKDESGLRLYKFENGIKIITLDEDYPK